MNVLSFDVEFGNCIFMALFMIKAIFRIGRCKDKHSGYSFWERPLVSWCILKAKTKA